MLLLGKFRTSLGSERKSFFSIRTTLETFTLARISRDFWRVTKRELKLLRNSQNNIPLLSVTPLPFYTYPANATISHKKGQKDGLFEQMFRLEFSTGANSQIAMFPTVSDQPKQSPPPERSLSRTSNSSAW